jgi:HPt (histidine-containing phosphotransfer) domain-containing protein
MEPKDAVPVDVQAALERLDGDRAFLYEMLEEFMSFIPEQIAELHSASQEQNIKIVERVSHSIKGSAATLSIEPMHLLALRLEEMAAASDLSSAGDVIAQMENELTRLRAFMATLK